MTSDRPIQVGADAGLIRRVEEITGDKSTDYPKGIDKRLIVPVWDLGREVERSAWLRYNPASTVYGSTFSVSVGGGSSNELLNEAKGFRIESAECLLEGATGSWVIQATFTARVRTGSDFIYYRFAQEQATISNTIFRPMSFNNIGVKIYKGMQNYDNVIGDWITVNEFVGFQLFIDRISGTGTGGVVESTIGVSLLY